MLYTVSEWKNDGIIEENNQMNANQRWPTNKNSSFLTNKHPISRGRASQRLCSDHVQSWALLSKSCIKVCQVRPTRQRCSTKLTYQTLAKGKYLKIILKHALGETYFPRTSKHEPKIVIIVTNGASIPQDSATAALQPEISQSPPGYLKTAVNFLTRSSARTRSVMSLSSTATPWTSAGSHFFFDFCPCQRYMQENHRGVFWSGPYGGSCLQWWRYSKGSLSVQKGSSEWRTSIIPQSCLWIARSKCKSWVQTANTNLRRTKASWTGQNGSTFSS